MSCEHPEVKVVLTDEMMRRFRIEALELGVPVEWLAASLIVDTIAALRDQPVVRMRAARRPAARCVA
ncbi:MAG: hypothetical protein KGM43_14690 [Planctomycetota bacterium]|nr:hypothetical protein [Planctomycetota bacterium]